MSTSLDDEAATFTATVPEGGARTHPMTEKVRGVTVPTTLRPEQSSTPEDSQNPVASCDPGRVGCIRSLPAETMAPNAFPTSATRALHEPARAAPNGSENIRCTAVVEGGAVFATAATTDPC